MSATFIEILPRVSPAHAASLRPHEVNGPFFCVQTLVSAFESLFADKKTPSCLHTSERKTCVFKLPRWWHITRTLPAGMSRAVQIWFWRAKSKAIIDSSECLKCLNSSGRVRLTTCWAGFFSSEAHARNHSSKDLTITPILRRWITLQALSTSLLRAET
jgi:hypothetical protein